MFMKISVWSLILVLTVNLCACGKKRMSGEEQRNYEEAHQEEIEQEALKLKEQGIVDEYGIPAPGVDLNDYPGLG